MRYLLLLAILASASAFTAVTAHGQSCTETHIGVAEVRNDGSGCLTIRNDALRENETIDLVSPNKPQTHITARIENKLSQTCSANAVIQADASFYSIRVKQDEAKPTGPAIAIAGIKGDIEVREGVVRADLNGDGRLESFRQCASAEGLHLTVWEGEPLKGRRLWHGWYYLGYDVEPGCSQGDYGEKEIRSDPSSITVEARKGKEANMSREKFFDTGKVKINYLDYGSSSAEPLVMLHGGAWCWQEYLSLIPSLARRWRVFALDLRGNGRSGWAPGRYRLEDFTEDTVAFIRQLDKPVVLVGHSLGGAVALMAAALCPEKVKALIIEDTPPTLDNYKRIVESGREMFGVWLELKRSTHSEQDLALALAERYGNFPGVTSQWLLFFARCLWQLDPTYFDSLVNDFDNFSKGYDYRQILARIKCPVLFIRGDTTLGAVMTDEEISLLRLSFSNVSFARIEGVGHLLHMQDQGQAQVLAEMTRFLERIAR